MHLNFINFSQSNKTNGESELIYKRKLTPSEARRHFIYVDEEHRSMFPPPGKEFEIIVKNQKIKVKVDSQWRIWAALFWDYLPSFQVGDVIVISKTPNGVLKIAVEKYSDD
jgi:hypothetical protein